MARRSKAKTRNRAREPSNKDKPKLTMAEMLARIPDRDVLTTKEVQHVFNDCHHVSVYRYVNRGYLTPMKNYGGANRYPKSQVEDLVRRQFSLVAPTSESETDAKNQKAPKGRKAKPRRRAK